MTIKIISFGHTARVGKDTAAEALVELGWTRIGFADALKKIVRDSDPEIRRLVDDWGWDSTKSLYPRARQLLQDVGEACRRHIWESVWIDAAISQFEEGGRYVIPDVRHVNEAQAIFALHGHVFRIQRPFVAEKVRQHVSETALASFPHWSGTIINDSETADDFKKHVVEYLTIGGYL